MQNAINVVVRVRPLSPKEAGDSTIGNVVHCFPDSVVVESHAAQSSHTGTLRSQKQYNFDTVFGPHASQDDVYTSAVRSNVQALFEGLNGAVLAYGATGSGKTHTMVGTDTSTSGVTYLAAREIMERADALRQAGRCVDVSVTYLEIYNEIVYDLLAPPTLGGKRSMLVVREVSAVPAAGAANTAAASGAPTATTTEIPNLSRHSVQTLDDFLTLFEEGVRSRAIGITAANPNSSRSHALLSVDVSIREREDSTVSARARLKLCDLAGSERAAAAQNRGRTFVEGANINKSLLALGAVVQALCQQQEGKFVPYRGSKLTRLLRDCLGGNSQTVMLVCVSPSSRSIEETKNTLQYATHAKQIVNTVVRNEVTAVGDVLKAQLEAVVERQRLEIAALREELCASLQGHSGVAGPAPAALAGLGSPAVRLVRRSGDAAAGAAAGGAFLPTPLLAASPVPVPCAATSTDTATATTTTTTPAAPSVALADAAVTASDDSLAAIDARDADTAKQLREKYAALRDEKLRLMQQLRSVDQAQDSVLKARIRAGRVKMAVMWAPPTTPLTSGGSSFGSTAGARRGGTVAGTDATNTSGDTSLPPIGVAGLRQQVVFLQHQLRTNRAQRTLLEEAIVAVDGRIRGLWDSVARQPLSPGLRLLNELLHENVGLCVHGLEAESIAAGYSAELARRETGREAELAAALERCTAVLREFARVDGGGGGGGRSGAFAALRRKACEALAYAAIPETPSEKLFAVFRAHVDAAGTGRLAAAPVVAAAVAAAASVAAVAAGASGASSLSSGESAVRPSTPLVAPLAAVAAMATATAATSLFAGVAASTTPASSTGSLVASPASVALPPPVVASSAASAASSAASPSSPPTVAAASGGGGGAAAGGWCTAAAPTFSGQNASASGSWGSGTPPSASVSLPPPPHAAFARTMSLPAAAMADFFGTAAVRGSVATPPPPYPRGPPVRRVRIGGQLKEAFAPSLSMTMPQPGTGGGGVSACQARIAALAVTSPTSAATAAASGCAAERSSPASPAVAVVAAPAADVRPQSADARVDKTSVVSPRQGVRSKRVETAATTSAFTRSVTAVLRRMQINRETGAKFVL